MSVPELASQESKALADVAARAWPSAHLARIETLAGDASARRYARLRLSGAAPASVIAMLLPHDVAAGASEELTAGDVPSELPFVDVQRFLVRHDVPVPELYIYDEAAGILLLEDLGDVPLADAALREGSDRAALFGQAIDVLARIAALGARPDPSCGAFRQRYDRTLIGRELDVVSSHGLASCDTGPARDPQSDPAIHAALARLGDRIAAQPYVLMHRDYHAWNLQVDARGKVRVIDFQDALLGPALYDLASLCTDRDSDRFVDAALEASLLQRFGAELARRGGPAYTEHARLRSDYFDAVAYRTLRVIGRFRFLAIEKGKPAYLRFLPRMAKQTRRALEVTGDAELLGLLAERNPVFA